MRIVLSSLLALCATGLAHATETNFEKRLAADPHGTVEISNVAGEVQVTAWDNPEVEVRADLSAGVERVDVTSDHGRTSIKVIVPNHSFRSISTDLRVRVPRDSDLDVSTVSAEIQVQNVQGGLQLKTVSGDVRADLFQKGAEIKTVSGDVVLHGHGQVTPMHVATISGSIRIDHAAGDLEGTTVSGDMTVHLDTTRSVRVRTTSGNLSFVGKLARGGSVDVETVSGDLSVRAAPEGGLEYEVSTFSGDITSCMGVEAERTSKYGPGRRLNGSKAAGEADKARIRIKTMSGDVELCDKT